MTRFDRLLQRRPDLSADRIDRLIEMTTSHAVGTGPTTRLGEYPRKRRGIRKRKFDRSQVEPQESLFEIPLSSELS